MKLRNKKTGEIATLTLSTNGEDMIIMGNDMLAHITKLSELKDYEEYEDPKEYWIIDWTSSERIDVFKYSGDDVDIFNKSIGNYFKSREEAEKAVEKLKAWRRLQDKGFRFEGWTIDDGLRISICTNTDSDGIYDDDKKRNEERFRFLFWR